MEAISKAAIGKLVGRRASPWREDNPVCEHKVGFFWVSQTIFGNEEHLLRIEGSNANG